MARTNIPQSARPEEPGLELERRYRAPLTAFFLRRVRNRAEAEDLTQEVFLRIVRSGGDAERATSPAFIFTVAANLLRDRSRRMQTSGGPLLSLESEERGNEAAAKLHEEISPERVLLGKEALQRVHKALGKLSPQTRDIFLLFKLEQMKQKQIAEIYGISVSAVEKHIVAALTHVTKELRR
jgi:RNA polymerase sigma-70 factor (ECF subfamily)